MAGEDGSVGSGMGGVISSCADGHDAVYRVRGLTRGRTRHLTELLHLIDNVLGVHIEVGEGSAGRGTVGVVTGGRPDETRIRAAVESVGCDIVPCNAPARKNPFRTGTDEKAGERRPVRARSPARNRTPHSHDAQPIGSTVMSYPPSTSPAATLLEKLSLIADEHPDRPAFVVAHPGGEDRLTFSQLRAEWRSVAELLRERGFGTGDVLVMAVHNHISYLSLLFGAWQAGLAVLPVSPGLAPGDRDALLAIVEEQLGHPVLVTTARHERYDTLLLREGGALPEPSEPAGRIRRRVEPPSGADGMRPYLYMTSGGATGLPKIMPFPLRWAGNRNMPYRSAGLKDSESAQTAGTATRLICGSLYHTGNFAPATHVLLTGSAVITTTEFDAALTVELLRRHSVYSLGITPGHMMHILLLPDLDREAFRNLSRVSHGAAPCPRWVKEGWLELVGPERLFEVYYSSELSGSGRPTIVSGTEWLKKPGTVGRPEGVRILDSGGGDLPPGVIGEIHVAQRYGKAHEYVGRRSLRRAKDDDTYVSVADLGWLDEDGYLFLADRMSDAFDVDGVTVYPGAVESAVAELPDVADVAVVGLWDEADGSARLHALVQPRPGVAADEALSSRILDHCAERLTPAEVPRHVQFTAALPRTAEGKMRKSVVREWAVGQRAPEAERPGTGA